MYIRDRETMSHTFLIISLGDWIVHTQKNWIVTCWNDPLWTPLKNYIDLAQIYSTVKTFPFCTKLILKIYTHTAYFTYSIANLRKRSVVSTHFLFLHQASLFWFKRAIRVQRQYFQCCFLSRMKPPFPNMKINHTQNTLLFQSTTHCTSFGWCFNFN